MEKETTVQVRLSEKLRDAMHEEAKRREMTLSAWLRLIVQEELKRRKRK